MKSRTITRLLPTCLTAGLLVALLAPQASAKPPILDKVDRVQRQMSKVAGRYGPWRVTKGHNRVVVAKSGIFWSDKSLQRAIRQPTPDGHGGRIGERVAGKVEISYATKVPRRGLGKLFGKVTGRTTKTQWKAVGATELVERAMAGKPTQVRGVLKVETYLMPNNDQLGGYNKSKREAAPAKTIKSASELVRWWSAAGPSIIGNAAN